MKLLVVDDNNVNRMVVLALLKRFNYDISIAINGKEALEKYKTRKFDCILMDIHMPQMDGITSTKLIREYEKNNSLDETPIIALTVSHPEEDKSKCFSAGMNDFIRKPVTLNDLSLALSNITTT
ncbi:MAG: hypothetical protein C0598_02640 [Marinilabiliales bacterium]|nr:MAG: hypothetical protein C0598_02640 [Marinilabiliales bacterium]